MRNNFLYNWWARPIPVEHLRTKDCSFKEYLYKFLAHPVKRRVAKYYLLFLQEAFGLKVVGITGSTGKTTTKEMTTAILSRLGNTVSSFANIDPVYNIPTTILRARPWTKYLVLEMGVEYPQEMDFYLWLAKPQVGVITNIYPTHTQFFGGEKGVAREKGKLVVGLPDNGFAVLNADNRYCMEIAKKVKAQKVLFGSDAEVSFENMSFTRELKTKYTLKLFESKINVQIPILGRQFVENSLAAACVGHYLGAKISDVKWGLEHFSPQVHRMRIIRHKSGAFIIDDTYNNNPAAAREALGTFESLSKGRKKVVVFGDMLELGKLEKSEHEKIGEVIGKMKVDKLVTVGKSSIDTALKAANFLPSGTVLSVKTAKNVPLNFLGLDEKAVVLIKGSRSIGLEELVSRLSRQVR